MPRQSKLKPRITSSTTLLPAVVISLQWKILEACLERPPAMHVRHGSTYHTVCNRFWRPDLRRDVDSYIRSRHHYQHSKVPLLSLRVPLCAIHLPPTYTLLGMGVIPKISAGNRYITSRINCLMKYAVAEPTSDAATAQLTIFLENVNVSGHGYPLKLISDHKRPLM